MNTPSKLILIAVFSILVPFVAFGASADVMVVVNGNTEVNRESFNFIRKVFSSDGVKYSITATMDPSTVKAGQYKTVVVLNTGVASGIDPVLQKFINGYADKKSLYLVNLFKGKKDLTIITFQAASNNLGVDGISAASAWGRGLGGDTQQMHREWVRELVLFLGRA